MSRIGKLPILIPEKVEIVLSGSMIKVVGPKGTDNFTFSSDIEVKQEGNKIIVSPKHDRAKALWGTTRAVIYNMVEGVTNGFQKSLEINGVGYKFEIIGGNLVLSIGLSHKVEMEVPTGISIVLDEKKKNILHISGISKQLVGEFAAKVKAKKKPEPYKGKGIKYVGEYIRRKAGKTGSK